MRSAILFAAIVALSACAQDGTLSPTAINALKSACVVDGVAQPLVKVVGTSVATAAGYGPEATAAAAIDQPVHDALQANCAALGGTVAPITK